MACHLPNDVRILRAERGRQVRRASVRAEQATLVISMREGLGRRQGRCLISAGQSITSVSGNVVKPAEATIRNRLASRETSYG